LLGNITGSKCFFLQTKDWWSYEFCYGQEVTQFHLENGKKVGQVISLGKYESDKTWLAKDLVSRLVTLDFISVF